MGLFLKQGLVVLLVAASIRPQLTKEDARKGAGNPEAAAILIHHVSPRYTPEAAAAKIEGSVGLEATVLPTGYLHQITVVQSLDTRHGLDAQAIAAAKQWRFTWDDARTATDPVPITFSIRFRLDDEKQHPGGPGSATPDEFVAGAQSLGNAKITPPRVVKRAGSRYSMPGAKAKIQGFALVEAVVDADGRVTRARVKDPLDRDRYGLDQNAIATASQFTFKPARLGGKAVPVLITLQIDFRIH